MQKSSSQDDLETQVDFAILTAIEIERKAVCDAFALTDDDRVQREGHWYWRGRLEVRGGTFYEIVIAQPTDMANVDMALLTNETIHQWKPRGLLLAGIAGAANEKVSLGDIILGKHVHYIERGKVTPAGKEAEPKTHQCDHLLLDAAMKRSEWKPQISVPRPDETSALPSVHDGGIACGDKKITDAEIRVQIATFDRKVLAIEMEAYGFLQAAWMSFYRPRALVIRAICDNADPDANDDWQPYAAAAVASFTKHFLQDKPLRPISEETINQQTIEETLSSFVTPKDEPFYGERLIEPSPISTMSSRPGEASQIDSNSELEKLISLLSQEKANRIDEIRERFREGRVRDAYETIRQMQDDASWQSLTSPVRAKALRALASFTLDMDDDIEKAKELVNHAKQIDPEADDTSIRAWLLFYEGHPDDALRVVGKPTSTETFNTKLNLLLAIGRGSQVLALIENPPDGIVLDFETKRIKALALIEKGELDGAEHELREVLARYPRRENLQTISAILDYSFGLSPAALPRRVANWPEPIYFGLVKKDNESQDRFRTAADKFAKLMERTQRGEEHKKMLETWRLACLANTLDQQEQASALCTRLLREDPANHRAVIWALVRNFQIDLPASEEALAQSIEARDSKRNWSFVERLSVLAIIYLSKDKPSEALELIERHIEAFRRAAAEDRVCSWKSQAFVALGQYGRAIAEAIRTNDVFLRRKNLVGVVQAIASKSGDQKLLAEYLEQCYEETRDGEYLLLLFSARGGSNE